MRPKALRGKIQGPCVREIGPAAARALAPVVARGLGFDLRAAIGARHVRIIAIHTIDGRLLPRDWAVPILRGEAVVACAPLESPFSGVAALVARVAGLPRPRLTAETREKIARALAEAMFAEVKRTTR